MSTAADEVRSGLAPMFREAREAGKWFWCHYQDLWFSPDELEAQHAKGKFLWGAANWRLRDPAERMAEAEARAAAANAEVARLREQMKSA